MVADGHDESDAQQTAQAEVHDRRGDQAAGATLEHPQGNGFVEEAVGLDPVGSHELMALPDAVADVALKILEEDLVHPVAYRLRGVKEVHHRGGHEIKAVRHCHV